MPSPISDLSSLFPLIRSAIDVVVDVLTVFRLSFRSSSALAAENLFLRKQLALYVERKKQPRRATNSVRFALAHLARFFDWRHALTVPIPWFDGIGKDCDCSGSGSLPSAPRADCRHWV